MKKIILLTAFLIVCMTISAQRIRIPEINAHSTLVPIDSLIFTIQYEVSMMENKDTPDALTKETMMLRVGKGVSEYYSYTSFVADSALRADMQVNASQHRIHRNMEQFGFGAITHRIYKNWPKGQMTYIDRIATDNFVVEEPLPVIEWEIHPDTATVCGYLCQKATTSLYGREYEAWYAPEIPRNDGPWKFHGLPGMILKAEDSQHHYLFECTGIEQCMVPTAIEFAETTRKKVSRKEMNLLQERFNADPQGYIRTNSPNVKIVIKDEMGNDIKKMSNPYNPIELK